MQQNHGKKFNLKHITVKVPNKRIPVAKAMAMPPSSSGGVITIDQTDSLLNDSDHSPSLSPTPPTPIETSLDFFPVAPLSPVAQDRGSLATSLNEQEPPPMHSLADSNNDSSSASSAHHPNMDSVSNGRGHNRNNSVDQVLWRMRSTGMSFTDEDRPSTLSRVQRGRLDKPRTGFLSVLVQVSLAPETVYCIIL